MHVECGCAIFGKHLKYSTMRCRKCNFVLIDIEVGLLLTFLASMKAKVRLYQKCVSVFGFSAVRFSAVHVTDPVFKAGSFPFWFFVVCLKWNTKYTKLRRCKNEC